MTRLRSRRFLCFNVGSSSLRFALFEDGRELLSGGIDTSVDNQIRYQRSEGEQIVLDVEDPADFSAAALALIQREGDSAIAVHRIVHGGDTNTIAKLLGPGEIARLEALSDLAPLHQAANLAPVRAIGAARPDMAQIAVYDTGFHRTLPPIARALSVAPEGPFQNLRRYGFHGLSHSWVAHRMAELAPHRRRVVSLHLSGGSSACAILDGESIDTSMGVTPLDGPMMGTRSGTVDPGAVLYALDQGMSESDLTGLLWRRSGLLGVSGLSRDTRDLLASLDPKAQFAIAMFCRQVAKAAAQMIVSLGGIDALVFTGGIGAEQPEIRASILADLAWAGLAFAEDANRTNAAFLSSAGRAVDIHVIPSEEEYMMARAAAALESFS